MADQLFERVRQLRLAADLAVAAEVTSIIEQEPRLLADDMFATDIERIIRLIAEAQHSPHQAANKIGQMMVVLRSAAHFMATQRMSRREAAERALDGQFFQKPDLEPSVVRGTL